MQGAPNDVLDLDEWMRKRKLDDRRIKIGKRAFRFRSAYSAEEIPEVDRLMKRGDLLGLLAYSLVDSSQEDDLRQVYREPADIEVNREFKNSVAAHLLKGVEVGESSASSPGSLAPAGTPASQDSAGTTTSTSETA